MTQRRYLIVIEGDGDSYSSYAPDLPGCVATGASRDEVEREMRAAVEFHVEGLQLAGQPIPEPSEFTAVAVEVTA